MTVPSIAQIPMNVYNYIKAKKRKYFKQININMNA